MLTNNSTDGLCQCGCGLPARIATKTNTKNGWVRGEPRRYLRGHNIRAYRGDPKEGPLYIVDENGCWIWQRHTVPSGYGRIKRDGRVQLAHRVFYAERYGPIPRGLQLDHLCRVRACVNPEHLEPVTCAENVRRGLSTRLTEGEVREIRRSSAPSAELALRFGLTRGTVNNIRSGIGWEDIVVTERQPSPTAARREAILRMRGEGLLNHQIAHALGMTQPVSYTHLTLPTIA